MNSVAAVLYQRCVGHALRGVVDQGGGHDLQGDVAVGDAAAIERIDPERLARRGGIAPEHVLEHGRDEGLGAVGAVQVFRFGAGAEAVDERLDGAVGAVGLQQLLQTGGCAVGCELGGEVGQAGGVGRAAEVGDVQLLHFLVVARGTRRTDFLRSAGVFGLFGCAAVLVGAAAGTQAGNARRGKDQRLQCVTHVASRKAKFTATMGLCAKV